MATKAPPQDDFNLDDIKLDDFPMEDNALFADLDNEMRADGGGEKSGDDLDLDLNLDLDGGSDSDMPALEEPGELKLDDTMDLDLNLDDAPSASAGSDSSGDADLDLNLDDSSGGSADDLNLDGDLDLSLEDAPSAAASGGDGEMDLKLDDDLDLSLDDDAPAAAASDAVDMDLDVGALDLNLDDTPAGDADSLSMDEPGEPSFSMDDPGDPSFDLDLPEETESVPSEGISLSVVAPQPTEEEMDLDLPEPDLELSEPEPAMDLAEPALDLPAFPEDEPVAAPAMAAAPEPEMDLTLGDEEISLDTIPAASTVIDDEADAPDFQAAPDVNLDDMDLGEISLSMEPGTAVLQPMGAQVNFEEPDASAPSMDEGFDLPPLAENKGDSDEDSAEPFVAVPDVSLTEDEVLELNVPHGEMGDTDPEFTMAPETAYMSDSGMGAPAMPNPGMGADEFRLTEPLNRGSMAAPRSATPSMGGGMTARPSGGMRDAAISQEILLSIPHKISVQMGHVDLIGKDIRNLAYGSVVQLNRNVGEPVDLLLDGRAIAQGEIVLINGKNLGVRILALNK